MFLDDDLFGGSNMHNGQKNGMLGFQGFNSFNGNNQHFNALSSASNFNNQQLNNNNSSSTNENKADLTKSIDNKSSESTTLAVNANQTLV